MVIQTIFSINGDNYAVEGMGQKTVAAVLRQYPLVKKETVNIVVLKGFLIDGKFVEPQY